MSRVGRLCGARAVMGDETPLPLLRPNNNERYPNCAGCKAAHFRDKGAPVPIKQLVCLSAVVLANALPISVLYPFLYFMVRDFHVAKSEEDIGYYAGWIGSSFMAGRFCTAMIWGFLADKYGRKPVMLLGILSVLVFNTLFGLSSSFTMALIMRFCLGSFNGMLGPVKAYVSEICPEQHQAVGVSAVSTAWALGLILGPALGGYLSQPAVKYPQWFSKTSVFTSYPYFLQALFVSVFAVFSLFMCFWLPETLHQHPQKQEEDVESNESGQPAAKKDSIFRNRSFMSSTTIYCLWSLHDIAYTEIFSLWAVSPRKHGGLSFTSSNVGEILAISGFCMLVFQLTLFPTVAKMLGPIRLTRISAFLAVPLLCLYPSMSRLQSVVLWVCVATASVIRFILTTSTMTGSFLLINNSVPQHQRGAANGFSLSIVSLFKAVGPAGGGSVFAWSQTRQDAAILPGDQLVFAFLIFFALLTAFATFEPFLPRTTDEMIDEEEAT